MNTPAAIAVAAFFLVSGGSAADAKEMSGERIDLAQLYGKRAVYLKFWATWYVPCLQQMPRFEQAYQTAGPGVAVIAVHAGFNDSLENIQRVRHKFGLTMPIVMDDGFDAGLPALLRRIAGT